MFAANERTVLVQNCGEDEEDEVITCSGKNDAVEKEMPLHYDQNEVIISSFKFFIYMFFFLFSSLHVYAP